MGKKSDLSVLEVFMEKPGVVAHTCNPSTWEAETGGSQVCDQPQELSEAFCNLVRPSFQIKVK